MQPFGLWIVAQRRCLDSVASTMTEINDPKRCQGCSGSGQVTKYFMLYGIKMHLGSWKCFHVFYIVSPLETPLVSLLVLEEALPKTTTCEKLDLQIFSINEVWHTDLPSLGWPVLPCQTFLTTVHWLWWSWLDGDLWKMMLVRRARCWCHLFFGEPEVR